MIRMLQIAAASMLGMSLIAANSARAADDKKDDAKPAVIVAVIKGTEAHKDIKGRLTFKDVDGGGVHVVGEISGLTPGKHGFHIHQKGDLSDPKLVSAGGHFNPGGTKHGGPGSDEKHAGDWGNIEANDKGVAKIEGTFKGVSLHGEKNGIMGRSVIVHAGADDLKTDPSGNSGDRIAGGVIEAKKPMTKDDAKKSVSDEAKKTVDDVKKGIDDLKKEIK
ncbi:superoxide dismutase family protein [Humisphaera borealis]|uniref:Superoxide dismutase family protein n=1 Tax=Humisphaera borealis TaxID=2807512 RepID=A0A7M2WVL4_9BACT|nr:superoxide dismutase family protein [Humisphaera borealis]QOV88881.1 superoxide dismutase family protein [Humisphaera borealis]